MRMRFFAIPSLLHLAATRLPVSASRGWPDADADASKPATRRALAVARLLRHYATHRDMLPRYGVR